MRLNICFCTMQLIWFYAVWDGILIHYECYRLNCLFVSRLMWPKQITLCGQWEQTSVINMLIHGSGRWISLFTMSIRCSSLQFFSKMFFWGSCFASLIGLTGWSPFELTFVLSFCDNILRMGVSMHCIPHHLSTLMQNMPLMSNGLLKLMISSREFYLVTLVLYLC